MDRKRRLNEQHRRLGELRDSFDQLGRKLSAHGTRLRNPGCPPDPALIEELSEAVRSFNSLAESLEKTAGELSQPGLVGRADCLAELEELRRRLADQLTVETERQALEPGAEPGISERDTALFTKPEAGPGGIEVPAIRARLTELICVLLRERRLEPAYWLACYHKQKFGDSPVPPVLIKAVELADIVEGDGGPAARWLEHAYRHPDFRATYDRQLGEARRWALNLLMAAALLRPALVAPGSGAPGALAGLGDLPPGIAALCGLLAERRHLDPGWERELEVLSGQARSWQQHNRKLSMAAPLATRLWKTMQEEDGLLHRLLRPLMEKDAAAADEIRRLVNRLRDEDELKSEIGRLYRWVQEMNAQWDIFHILGSWQILARLREAMDLAERWLDIQTRITEARKQVGAPWDDELHKHLQAARGDLEAVHRQYPDHSLVTAGVSLCGHALAILDSHLQRDRETTPWPEELATRELCKHPQLKLEPFWMPAEEAVERLGKALVELLDDLPLEQREGAGEKGFAEIFTAEAAELDRLWDGGILTPQEKRFIRDTFFDRLGKGDPETGR